MVSGRTKNMGTWNTVNYIDRTLEMINYGDKSVKYVGRNASSTTTTGNFNKLLATKSIRKDIKRLMAENSSHSSGQ